MIQNDTPTTDAIKATITGSNAASTVNPTTNPSTDPTNTQQTRTKKKLSIKINDNIK